MSSDKEKGFVGVPNWVFDEVMPAIKGNHWKAYCVILRKTLGFNKRIDAIPVTQFQAAGIKDKETILGIVSDLEDGGFINVSRKNGKTNVYEILAYQSGKTIPVEAVGENHTSRVNSYAPVGENPTATSREKPDTSIDNTTDNIQQTIIATTLQRKSVSKPKVKPSIKTDEKYDPKRLTDLGCSLQLAQDFIVLRKIKKSAITDSAINLLVSQARKAGIELTQAIEICIARNWVSFNASWKWQDTTAQPTNKWDVLKTSSNNFERDVTPSKKSNEYLEYGHA